MNYYSNNIRLQSLLRYFIKYNFVFLSDLDAADVVWLIGSLAFDVDGVAGLVLDAVVVASVSGVIASGLVPPNFAEERLLSDDVGDHVLFLELVRHRRRSEENFVAFRVAEGLVVASQVSSVLFLLLSDLSTSGFSGIFFTGCRVAGRRISVVHFCIVVSGRVVFVVSGVDLDGRKLFLGRFVRKVVHFVVGRFDARRIGQFGAGRHPSRVFVGLHFEKNCQKRSFFRFPLKSLFQIYTFEKKVLEQL